MYFQIYIYGNKLQNNSFKYIEYNNILCTVVYIYIYIYICVCIIIIIIIIIIYNKNIFYFILLPDAALKCIKDFIDIHAYPEN